MGVTLVVMWHNTEAHEQLYCNPDCAKHDGWPFLLMPRPASKG